MASSRRANQTIGDAGFGAGIRASRSMADRLDDVAMAEDEAAAVLGFWLLRNMSAAETCFCMQMVCSVQGQIAIAEGSELSGELFSSWFNIFEHAKKSATHAVAQYVAES